MTSQADVLHQPIARIQQKLGALALDAVLITRLLDIRWATGFTGSNALLVVTKGAAHFVTDRRYGAQARRQVTGAAIHVPGYALVKHVAESEVLAACKRVGFQADEMTAAAHAKLAEQFEAIAWEPVEGFLKHDVARKSEDEVAHIRTAQCITEAVFAEACALLRPGITERDIAAEIIYRHLKHGAERQAFEPIVASGPNSALPHARPSDRVLKAGDVVVLDFGCVVNGYASDMTRTVVLGEASAEVERVYRTVLEANKAAIVAALPGMTSKVLDAVARDHIATAGYSEAFGHSLGHGVGLDVHEWPPVSFRSEEELPENCVVTIEPGIYLEGQFGVRIEDMIWLKASGAENLTSTPKSLRVLPV
ncbi:MAG: Xaa-Pro peptidase family protein [Bacteroidota bacterium]